MSQPAPSSQAAALPADIADALHRARQLEDLAGDDRRRWLWATRATTSLVVAIRAAGWDWPCILAELDLSWDAMRWRVSNYRKENGESAVTGLISPAAPLRPTPQTVPVAERRWLSSSECMRLAGVSSGTMTLWRRAGLLPGTVQEPGRRTRYAHADLDRIARAPRRGARRSRPPRGARGKRRRTCRQSRRARQVGRRA